VEGQQLNANTPPANPLQTPDSSTPVILRTNSDGPRCDLRMWGESRIGTENYDIVGRYKGNPGPAMALSLAAGANALDPPTGSRANGGAGKILPAR